MSKLFETTNTRTISKFDYDPNSSSSISNHMLFLEDSFFIFSYKNTVSVLAIIDSFLPVITSDNIFTFDFPSTLIQVRGDIGEKSIVVLHYDSSKNLSTFSTLLITNIIHRNSELESQIVIENKVNDFYVVSQRQYLIIDSNKKMSLIKDNETLFMFNDYVDIFLFDLKRQIISCVNTDKNNIVIWNDGLRGISFQENLDFLGKKNNLVIQIGFFLNFIFFICSDETLHFYSIKDGKITKTNSFEFKIETIKSRKNLIVGVNDIDRTLFIFERDRNFTEVFVCENNSDKILMLNPIYFFEGIIGVAFNFGKKNDDYLSTMYLLKNDGMISEISRKKQKNVEEKIQIFKKNEEIELNKIENELKIKNMRLIKKFEIFVEKKINSIVKEDFLNEEQVSNFHKEIKTILTNFKEIFKEIYQNCTLFYKEKDKKQLFCEFEKMKSFYIDEQLDLLKSKINNEFKNEMKNLQEKDIDISNETIKKMFSMQKFAKKEKFNSQLFSLFLSNEKKEKFLDYDSSCKSETILQIKLINKQINELKSESSKVINFLNQLKKYSTNEHKEKIGNIYKSLFISFMKYFEDYYYTLEAKFEQQIKTKIEKQNHKDKLNEKMNIIEICKNDKKEKFPSFTQQKLEIDPHQKIENQIKFVSPTKTFSTTKKCIDLEDVFTDNSENDKDNDDIIEKKINEINGIIKDYETYYDNTKKLSKTIKQYNKKYNELVHLNINLKKVEKERKSLNDITLANEFFGKQKENEKRQAQAQSNSAKKFTYKTKTNQENKEENNINVNIKISNAQNPNEKKENPSINPFVITENPPKKENNPFISTNNPPNTENIQFSSVNNGPNIEKNNPLEKDNNPFIFQPSENQKNGEKNKIFPLQNSQIKPSLINNNNTLPIISVNQQEKYETNPSLNPFIQNNKNITQLNTDNTPFSNVTNPFTNLPSSNNASNTQTVFNPLPLKKESNNPFLNPISSEQTSSNFMFPSKNFQQENPTKHEYQNPFYMGGKNKNSQTKVFTTGEKENSFLVIHNESKEKKEDIFISSISPIRKINIETPQVLHSENKQPNPFANIGVSFGQDFFNLNKK